MEALPILASLNEINGVVGSALFDETDECIAHKAPAPYEPILLAQVMGGVRNALELVSSLDEAKDSSSFHIWLDEGCLVLRTIESLNLLVLGTANLNMSMLSVGLNVASLKLAKAKATNQLSRSSPNVGTSGAVGTSSRQVSSLTPVSNQEGQVRLPNAVGPAVVDALIKMFARHIGPFAKMAVKEEMKKLGVTPYSLVPAQFDDLISILSTRLPDAAKRSQFIAEGRTILSRR
jgi:hypothetical protein